MYPSFCLLFLSSSLSECLKCLLLLFVKKNKILGIQIKSDLDYAIECSLYK